MATETQVANLKINTLTKAQYNTITPSATELYFTEEQSSLVATYTAATETLTLSVS